MWRSARDQYDSVVGFSGRSPRIPFDMVGKPIVSLIQVMEGHNRRLEWNLSC